MCQKDEKCEDCDYMWDCPHAKPNNSCYESMCSGSKKELKGVSWKEAFEAGLQGKNIKVYGQYLTYPDFKPLDFALGYLAVRPGYYQNLMKKEWYIENEIIKDDRSEC